MKPLLSVTEQAVLIYAYGLNHATFSSEEAERAVTWAESVRIDAALLHNVLSGKLTIDFNKGEPIFRATAPDEEKAILSLYK